ncbi:MAG: hypothetical protein ACLUNO_08135 [Oscillospiraceae bacterium]
MDEAETYLRAGQFGAGSMQPKVAAAVQFVRSGWRRRAVIASLEQAPAAMRGEAARASCRKNAANRKPAPPVAGRAGFIVRKSLAEFRRRSGERSPI